MRQITVPIPDRFRPALAILLTAYDYAQDSQTDPWQFAVEFPELLSSGATLDDVRWLIHRGFAEHARETTIPGDEKRTFRRLAPTAFPSGVSVVLTSAGAAAIRPLVATPLPAAPPPLGESSATPALPSPGAAPARRAVAFLKPEWDSGHRELRYAGRVVKRFRVPALNQIAILDAFQEEGWPEFIDDPIPPADEQDPKHRLNVTIKSLNRHQINRLIRFHGNGDGLQVHWEAVKGAP